MKQLGPDADRVQVLFVTVDPERDTPALLAQYVPAFDPRFVGLYGDAEATERVGEGIQGHLPEAAGPARRARYTMDHSAGAFIFDPQGRLRLYVGHGQGPDVFAHDLRELLRTRSPDAGRARERRRDAPRTARSFAAARAYERRAAHRAGSTKARGGAVRRCRDRARRVAPRARSRPAAFAAAGRSVRAARRSARPRRSPTARAHRALRQRLHGSRAARAVDAARAGATAAAAREPARVTRSTRSRARRSAGGRERRRRSGAARDGGALRVRVARRRRGAARLGGPRRGLRGAEPTADARSRLPSRCRRDGGRAAGRSRPCGASHRELGPAVAAAGRAASDGLADGAPAVVARRGDRLRVGYLSTDFHDHATAHLAAGVFERHDRARVESRSRTPPTATTAARCGERLRAAFDALARRARRCPTRRSPRRIAADDLDVLVDLKGHTHGDALRHPRATGRRRCSSTTSAFRGRSRYDARRRASSPMRSSRRPGSERRLRGARAARCRAATRSTIAGGRCRRRRRAPASGCPSAALVLACFNQAYKLTRAVRATRGSTCCAAHGDAVLWLTVPHALAQPQPRGSPRRHARRRGARRSCSRRMVAQPAHVARLRCADLALDVLPVRLAHDGQRRAVRPGVPLLTLPRAARSPAASARASRDAAGLRELVAASLADYRARCRELLAPTARGSRTAASTSSGRERLPLFDTEASRAISSGCSKARRTRVPLTRRLPVLDQLDLVAVRVLDERDHRRAALDRPGVARDRAALAAPHRGARGRGIGHRDRDVAEPVPSS